MKQLAGVPALSVWETQLIDRLRQQAALLARVQRFLDLARAAAGPLKSADAVKELFVQELRQSGQATMRQWGMQAEVRVGDEPFHAAGRLGLEQPDPQGRRRSRVDPVAEPGSIRGAGAFSVRFLPCQ